MSFLFTIETPPRDRAPLRTSGQPVSAKRGAKILSILDEDDDDDAVVVVVVGAGEDVVVVGDDTNTRVGFFIRCTVTFKQGQGKYTVIFVLKKRRGG